MRYKYLIIFSIVALIASFLIPNAGFASILLSADNFAVLAGSTVTNTGNSTVNGDIGVWPGSAIAGYGSIIHTGTLYLGTAVPQQAQSDLTTAYNNLAGMPVNSVLTGQDLGGKTLAPGVYQYASGAQLTGTLFLDANFNNNVTWVFQIGSALTTAPNAKVILINPGLNNGVFWQVGSSATLDTGTAFEGNILAYQSIALNTGTTLNGRALARTAEVTLQGNTINNGFLGGPLGPSPIPEPSTMLLLGIGGVATAFIRKRRKT